MANVNIVKTEKTFNYLAIVIRRGSVKDLTLTAHPHQVISEDIIKKIEKEDSSARIHGTDISAPVYQVYYA